MAAPSKRNYTSKPSPVDIAAPNVLEQVFSVQSTTYTIKRMASARDKDNLIAHPLRAALLMEFETELSEMISRSVCHGFWNPSASYLCLTLKRSGSYRELVFPGLIDAIVGRRGIDALEPLITRDDHDRVFCGRSHASSNREPGDYESWFQTWRDFSSAITQAAKGEQLAYVFDTDVSDFFPSIDRARARQFLSQRTGAHPALIELIFYCLEAWLPRFDYMPAAGLPIESNDVSRLVAHNYLKLVDEQFPDGDGLRYRRYVDDTTIFVRTEAAAEEAKRRHHLALRMVGLNPNAAKSSIISVEDYEAQRHREVNVSLSRVARSMDERAFNKIVRDWYRDRKRINWDQVAKRLYRLAGKHQWKGMTRHVASDLAAVPALGDAIASYLLHLGNCDAFFDAIMDCWARSSVTPEQRIHLARVLCDASFSLKSSARITNFVVEWIRRRDRRAGTGYARGLLLLALNKHGQRADRQKILNWASPEKLTDSQLRLHFLYVFLCRGEFSPELRLALQQLSSSDTDLMLQLCDRALAGQVRNARRILRRYVRVYGGMRTVEARVLPLAAALASGRNPGVLEWLEEILRPPSKVVRGLRDVAVQRLLQQLRDKLVS